ncbi:MAG: hypothetical protein WKF79_03305 [Nocardioides sp.]
MSPGDGEGRPLAGAAPNAGNTDSHILPPRTPDAAYLADLDALCESLRGHFVVQVVVDDAGHRRTTVYRSAGAAERAVHRARDRGRTAHVSLVQMLPVGVVVGLEVAR